MGACGCIEIQYSHRTTLADGRVLLIGVYGSCQYCDSPAGVQFWAVSKNEADSWCQGPNELLDDDNDAAGIPVIETRFVREAMEKAINGFTTQDGHEVDTIMAEIIAEETFNDLRGCVARTQRESIHVAR